MGTTQTSPRTVVSAQSRGGKRVLAGGSLTPEALSGHAQPQPF